MSTEEKVKFLMHVVCMQETSPRSRLKYLEGELPARGSHGSSTKDLSRYFHLWAQLQHIVTQFTQFAYIDGGKVCRLGRFLNLSCHFFLFYCIIHIFGDMP